MELAKVTSKGQITIPKEIREILKIKEGSKILFFKKAICSIFVIYSEYSFFLNDMHVDSIEGFICKTK